jgi:hypothetical protein
MPIKAQDADGSDIYLTEDGTGDGSLGDPYRPEHALYELPDTGSGDLAAQTAVQGATSDAAVTSDAAGTLSGKLRGLIKWAYEQMPSSLGQAAMAACFPVVLASDHSDIKVTLDGEEVGVSSVAMPSALVHNKKTVATPGSAEALAGSASLESGVTIKALPDNTGLVYVGGSSVASTNGHQLAAGEEVFVEIADPSTVYLDVDTGGEGVTYIGS